MKIKKKERKRKKKVKMAEKAGQRANNAKYLKNRQKLEKKENDRNETLETVPLHHDRWKKCIFSSWKSFMHGLEMTKENAIIKKDTCRGDISSVFVYILKKKRWKKKEKK